MISNNRARLRRRAVNDLEKDSLQTFSATASRLAQELIPSEVCLRRHQGWRFATVGGNRAFPKWTSHEELAVATGVLRPVVNIELTSTRLRYFLNSPDM